MSNKGEIGVTISCITYNHVDYIADAIESFLMQETDFEYEILIHDDASTDGTADIVRSYMEKYPDKIHAILQEENQYSQGVNIASTFLRPIARGKYIATCEGDDFYTDPKKLQKQYDYMEAHPDCSMYLHEAHWVSEDKSMEFRHKHQYENNKILGMEEAIIGIGIETPTNSFFVSADIWKMDRPEFAKASPVGDYITPIIMAQYGYIYYSPEELSAYRVGAKNSWCSIRNTSKEGNKLRYEDLEKTEKTMQLMDEYFQYKYSDFIQRRLLDERCHVYRVTRNWDELKKEPYKSMLKQESFRNRMQLYTPKLFSFLQKIHYRLLKIRGLRY